MGHKNKEENESKPREDLALLLCYLEGLANSRDALSTSMLSDEKAASFSLEWLC